MERRGRGEEDRMGQGWVVREGEGREGRNVSKDDKIIKKKSE